MPAKLTVSTETKKFTAEVPTAQGELIDTMIKIRLEKGLSTPLLMETPDGQRSEHVEIATADQYTMEFGAEGTSSVTTDALAHEAMEADTYIDQGGYIRITTDEL
ncbi:hypothetical protein [Nesterenkonia haasae]|uniref:hypothetical protein n=1 Tax=Nesterenkonia haasae TaxID=2587813 RepID=UPI0013912051|nr:hypothetical protein [Nesterenkonia haasae]NDK30627.1 hypothetical protein [Nesterenkonia haasae]